jgi:hypothetical protein
MPPTTQNPQSLRRGAVAEDVVARQLVAVLADEAAGLRPADQARDGVAGLRPADQARDGVAGLLPAEQARDAVAAAIMSVAASVVVVVVVAIMSVVVVVREVLVEEIWEAFPHSPLAAEWDRGREVEVEFMPRQSVDHETRAVAVVRQHLRAEHQRSTTLSSPLEMESTAVVRSPDNQIHEVESVSGLVQQDRVL